MLKELSTGEIYVAKIFINLDIFSCVKEKERKFHISSKINKIAILDHQAIIKLIGYSPKTFNGSPIPTIVTEVAINGSLHQIIERNKQSPISEWNDIQKLICMYGITAGMTYLHSENISHCNLRTKTVYMDDFSSMIDIDDFYSANDINLESQNDDNSLNIDELKSCDAYCFGFIVYEIMTGLNSFLKILKKALICKYLMMFQLRIRVSLKDAGQKKLKTDRHLK